MVAMSADIAAGVIALVLPVGFVVYCALRGAWLNRRGE